MSNWTKVLDKNDSDIISSLICGNSMYVAEDSGGRKYYTSTDGISWYTIANTTTYCDARWYNTKDKNFYTLMLDSYAKNNNAQNNGFGKIHEGTRCSHINGIFDGFEFIF